MSPMQTFLYFDLSSFELSCLPNSENFLIPSFIVTEINSPSGILSTRSAKQSPNLRCSQTFSNPPNRSVGVFIFSRIVFTCRHRLELLQSLHVILAAGQIINHSRECLLGFLNLLIQLQISDSVFIC